MRIDTDTNGNQWFEDLSEEGFKRIVTDFKANKLEMDLRNEKLSRTNYNDNVLVLTTQNGTRHYLLYYSEITLYLNINIPVTLTF